MCIQEFSCSVYSKKKELPNNKQKTKSKSSILPEKSFQLSHVIAKTHLKSTECFNKHFFLN